MKIIYYTDQVYLHGGLERVLTNKINYLCENTDNEIHLVTFEQRGKASCYPIHGNVTYHNLDINYSRKLSYFHFLNFSKAPLHFLKLKNKLKEIKPDVLVVCNSAFDFYFIPFISKGIKTIKEFHSSRYYYINQLPKSSLLNKFLNRINNFIHSKYSHIVVLNNDETKYYKSNNIVVIPNAIKRIENTNKIQRKNVIIAAGRIAPVKQFDHLIKAWSIIAYKFPEWEVHIYGDGDESLSTNLKQMIGELAVPTIYLKGGTSHLTEKMQEASLYALTSSTECFPMVLLESLACGLPIISYNCPHGPKNIMIDGEDGMLTPLNNIAAFALELEKLIKNQALRKQMEKNALNNCKKFEETKIMQQWLYLFKRLRNDI